MPGWQALGARAVGQSRLALAVLSPLTCACRYGDEQHLDEALNRIWNFGRQGNPPKKMCPTLVGLREETVDVSWLGGGQLLDSSLGATRLLNRREAVESRDRTQQCVRVLCFVVLCVCPAGRIHPDS